MIQGIEDLKRSSERLLRLSQVLAPEGPIPVSKSTWWRGIKSGRFPAPIYVSERICVWKESDVRALCNNS